MVKTREIFLLSEIVDKSGISDGLQGLFKDAKAQSLTETEVGVRLIMMLMTKLHLVKAPVVQLLANVTGKKVEEIDDMPLKDFMAVMKQVMTDEGVLDFFKEKVEDLKLKTSSTTQEATESQG